MKPDRASEEAARQVMERVYPDESLRRVALRLLADSIRVAHAAGPAAWELTLKKGGFTFNVGMIFALGIEIGGVFTDRDEPDPASKDFSMTVDGMSLRPATQQSLADVVAIGPSGMRSLPFLLDVTMARNGVARLREHPSYGRLFASHKAIITAAARKRPTTVWWRSHSTGLIEYLRTFLDRDIPDPSYIDSPSSDAAYTLVGSRRR